MISIRYRIESYGTSILDRLQQILVVHNRLLGTLIIHRYHRESINLLHNRV